MCGINGLIYGNPVKNIASAIAEMNRLVIHRGPDDEGAYVYEGRLAMGMRRLSVVDLPSGRQPMYNSDRSLVITFNGEIYNFRELGRELRKKGVAFLTRSDTEVALKMYEAYGTDCFRRFNGMFAIAIHDRKKKQVIIARDRFGEKPLFYCLQRGQFTWASELKSLRKVVSGNREIDPQALRLFLSLTYIPAPYTIYRNICKLEPGHYMIFETENFSVSKHKYWDVPVNPPGFEGSYQAAKRKLRDLLFDAVEKRMIADVPVGCFLSGGTDSAIVAAIMADISGKRISTFSIGSADKRYDESARAKVLASHIRSDHHEYRLDNAEMLSRIDDIIINYDEPFADSSCLPAWYVSRQASRHVKVALTGDGADEVFGGYNKYLIHSYGRIYEKFVPGFIGQTALKLLSRSGIQRNTDSRSFLSRMGKFIAATGNDTVTNHFNILSLGFKKEELQCLMAHSSGIDVNAILSRYIPDRADAKDKLKIARYLDKNISLEGDMLVKVERASMLCSLECRAPFLDHRLMAFSYTVPDSYLIRGNDKKRILKDAFEDLVPEGYFNAPKSGFEIPMAAWLRNELEAPLVSALSEENLNRHGFFNAGYISRLIAEHLGGKSDHSFKLWTVYCFQKWFEARFME